MNRRCITLLMLAASTVLGACSESHQDLEQFVADVKARPAAPIAPIPTIARYQPFAYRPQGRRAPFTPTIENDQPARVGNGLTPDAERPSDPLEAFPLDGLRMVGSISRGGAVYALIQAPDKIIYRVSRGDHLGQNYGEIDSVSEHGVTLTEIVPDGRGGYVERPATIAP